MARQTQLGGGFTGIEEAIVFYRPAKSQQTQVEPEEQPVNSPSELEDVGELLSYIQRKKLRYPVPLVESEMEEAVRSQIMEVVENGPNEVNVKFLLSLFCGSLQGKQRMKNKYAMLIYLGEALLVAHVRAEKGMSLKEEAGEIELIRRFLDVDNILSAALFETKDDDIVFSHFTDTGSDAFREFLGVRPQKYHYEKKNIQIICHYHGNRELEVKFEFSNDEFDNLWLQERSVQLSGSQFTPVEGERAHQIKEIRWGSESYDSVDRFKSDFQEHTLDLDHHRKRYDRLHSYPTEESDDSVYSADRVLDRRHKLELTRGDRREVIEKDGIPDDLHVIYASKHIEIDGGFADDVFQDIINNLTRRIYHPSTEVAASPFSVNNLTFLNIEGPDLSSDLKEFIKRTHSHAVNRGGETLSKCLVISMLNILGREVEGAFQHGLRQILNVSTGNPRDRAVVSTKENEGGALVEYKNAKSLEGDDPAGTIVDYIKTEHRKDNGVKVFMFGFTEQNRQIEGFDTQSWNDDRVSSIEDRVKELMDDEGISYGGFLLQNIELGDTGDRWAIVGMVY